MKARFTDEQIIKLLKEHEAGEGAPDIIRSMLEGQHPVGLSPTRLPATSKDIPHC